MKKVAEENLQQEMADIEKMLEAKLPDKSTEEEKKDR